MQVDRIEEMRMTATDEISIGQLLDQAFGVEYRGRSYFQNRHHVRFVVRDGADIIGHMAISLRAARMGNTLIQVAGLAEVATHPDHRGKGIASAMMVDAIAEAKASPADFFMLFGDEKLYAGVGFVAQSNQTRTISMFDVWSRETEDRNGTKLMVMPLRDVAWDPDAMIDLVGYAF